MRTMFRRCRAWRVSLTLSAVAVIGIATGAVATGASATDPQPYLMVSSALRGGRGDVYGFYLPPNTSYVLSSDVELLALPGATPTTTSIQVTTDAQGRFRATGYLPLDLPLTVDTITVTLTPQASSDPLLTATASVLPPTFLLPAPNCPGQLAPVEFLGFPPGSYVLSSPDVSFSPDTTTFDATGVPTRIEATIANNAPTNFTAYATPTGSTTPAATVAFTLWAPSLSGYSSEGSFHVSGGCFGPNQPLTITSTARGVSLPAQAVPDSNGQITFTVKATAWANPRQVSIDATDAGTGRAAQALLQVPGTTLRVGQQLRDSSPATLASPDMHYQLSERACTLELRHYVLIHGVVNEPVIWSAGEGGYNIRTGCHLSLQPDGNLVLYTARGKALWSAGTQHTGSDNRLVLRETGNLVLSTKAGRSVWSSKYGRKQLAPGQSLLRGQSLQTDALNVLSDKTRLVLTTTGNLVLTDDGHQRWSSHTAGRGGTRLTMQTNGNLVLRRANGTSVWSSRTAGHGSGNHLLIRPGRAVILDRNRHIIWHT